MDNGRQVSSDKKASESTPTRYGKAKADQRADISSIGGRRR
jgi:hypothetical protein